MTGPSEAMKAAFPPKLSERAKRLDKMLCKAFNLFPQERADLCKAITADLGITPKMVEDVRPLLQPSARTPHAMNLNAAAIALSTLLEVAGE